MNVGRQNIIVYELPEHLERDYGVGSRCLLHSSESSVVLSRLAAT